MLYLFKFQESILPFLFAYQVAYCCQLYKKLHLRKFCTKKYYFYYIVTTFKFKKHTLFIVFVIFQPLGNISFCLDLMNPAKNKSSKFILLRHAYFAQACLLCLGMLTQLDLNIASMQKFQPTLQIFLRQGYRSLSLLNCVQRPYFQSSATLL